MTKSVSIEQITKKFDSSVAVNNVSIEIGQGEFFTLLGSSGCGKTTLLRMVAGFLQQSSGHIRFDRKIIDTVPAHERNTGMVFQNYAIFPHLTVAENVAYGLKVRKQAKGDIDREVRKMLELVRLDHLAHRLPRELSGGQQQRVVLARALAIRPDVLLMDEPLSNLDTEMRLHLRSEIRAIQQQFGVTTIYVTHDQEEALLISDRVAVMSMGNVEQIARPGDIYLNPQTLFVASFIGDNNLIPVEIEALAADGTASARLPSGERTEARAATGQQLTQGTKATLSLRPQDIDLAPAGTGGLQGKLTELQFLGGTIKAFFDLGTGKPVTVSLQGRHGTQIPVIGETRSLIPLPGATTLYAGEVKA
ncbi:ABC transporter ATP-binding protein [Xinfangfangia sp. D13-10-4-6]|uniref:ABC transporter ATP-binding protein n=1 Tax=Pseudogemmobacter hezensis TaxID=2737662 RepID=UPI00155572FC|nr:ABC transporter ATP-binding protein [Pseudogemmobacter hezensis]NPD17270.1 ABC transporter ATP-binding protein [Pseudogemmobacter hezensis]